MNILVDSDLLEEYFLNRDNDIFPYAKKLWNIIYHSPKVKTYITSRCLKKICDPENMEFPEDAEVLAVKLKSRFTICSSSPQIFKNARQSDSKIEPAIELECGIKIGIDAITAGVTRGVKRYI